MDSAENTQEGRFERVREGSAEDAANHILNMWDSQEQTASEETDTPVDEEVVEETEEAEEVEEEAPEEEEGQAEEETEEEVEEEEETEIVAEEDLKYTIKVDGEELEVGIEELKNGYQRQADYTRKSQALAEQRKETEQIQSERQKLEQERQMYANGLQMLQEQQSSKLQEFENVDWTALKTEDPYQYMLKKDEYRDAQEKVQKSGRGNSKEDAATEAIKKKRARLQKSGKQQDAASVFYDML